MARPKKVYSNDKEMRMRMDVIASKFGHELTGNQISELIIFKRMQARSKVHSNTLSRRREERQKEMKEIKAEELAHAGPFLNYVKKASGLTLTTIAEYLGCNNTKSLINKSRNPLKHFVMKDFILIAYLCHGTVSEVLSKCFKMEIFDLGEEAEKNVVKYRNKLIEVYNTDDSELIRSWIEM
jgi:hypothetical protein